MLKKAEIKGFPSPGQFVFRMTGALLFMFVETYPSFGFGRVVATILLFGKTRK